MKTTQIQRAQLLESVKEEAHGEGLELLRLVLMVLDTTEELLKEFVDTFGPNDSACEENKVYPPCTMCRAEKYLEKPDV